MWILSILLQVLHGVYLILLLCVIVGNMALHAIDNHTAYYYMDTYGSVMWDGSYFQVLIICFPRVDQNYTHASY